ncbi:hypothetical protein FKM82_002626 [Ascaphus truei]
MKSSAVPVCRQHMYSKCTLQAGRSSASRAWRAYLGEANLFLTEILQRFDQQVVCVLELRGTDTPVTMVIQAMEPVAIKSQ